MLVTELGAGVNARDSLGMTPLHFAAADGHTDVIRILVKELGADISAVSNDLQSVLHFAAHNGHASMLCELAKEYVITNVEAKDKRGCTPLHIAAKRGHVESVRVLVRYFGADVNAFDGQPFGWSPLHYAFEGHHYAVAHVLLKELGANGTSGCALGLTPDEVETFVSSGLYETIASRCGNDTGNTFGPQSEGEEEGDANEVSPAETRACEAICFAAQTGNNGLARLLVKTLGVAITVHNTDWDDWTPLHYAAAAGDNCDTARMLVQELGADVGAKDKYGATPLHCVAAHHAEMAVLLVKELGADVNARNEDGFALLHYAVTNVFDKGESHFAVARALVKELGADVNVRTNTGLTALHLAVETANSLAVSLLGTELGANVHAKDNEGRTPLHSVSSRFAHDIYESETAMKIVHLLSEHGADVNARDTGGATPLHAAATAGDHCVARALVRSMAPTLTPKTTVARRPSASPRSANSTRRRACS